MGACKSKPANNNATTNKPNSEGGSGGGASNGTASSGGASGGTGSGGSGSPGTGSGGKPSGGSTGTGTGTAAPTPTPPPAAENPIVRTDIHHDYDIGPIIGKGETSEVHVATHRQSQEKYAIKIIQKSKVENLEEQLESLIKEIRINKQLDHKNLLKLIDVYEDDKAFYSVMEYVPDSREVFDKIVERGNYSERDAANIVRQVLEAVAYLHTKNFAHRDLKPENLLSVGSGESEIIKISHFGFGKSFAGDTKLQTSVGSPGYVAPEVLTEDHYDCSVDMWSIGVILYILLSGYPPFYADNPPDLFKKIVAVDYDFDDPSWKDVSESAKELIRNLLVREPEKRWTAERCLSHPWVTGSDAKTDARAMNDRLKDYQQQRRAKK